MKQRQIYLCILAVVSLAGAAVYAYQARPKPLPGRQVLYWVDPMHPSYRSDKPGTAPDCGMALEPVYADKSPSAALTSNDLPQQAIELDTATRQLYGIRLAKVEMNAGKGILRVFGRVAPDQTRVYRVNLGTDGFVKDTYNDAVGNHVAKNQHLAIVYSPEFLAVAGGYLSANERTPAGASAMKDNIASSTTQGAASSQARADRLRNLGMSDSQIDEIGMSRKIPENVYVVSPTDGFVLSRSISPGVRFERYMEMYTIADLSKVWILAEVFGKDAQAFRPGTTARVTLPDTGDVFEARVSDVLPEVDPATRILKARLVVDNPRFKLRPEMFVNIDLPISSPSGLSVPASAVIDSGLSKRVFVETSDNRFETREVQTGWCISDRIEIVSGLREGDMVVAEGAFLVDSESRLQIASNAGQSPQESPAAKPALAHSAKSTNDAHGMQAMDHAMN